MKTTETVEIEICVDCLMVAANGISEGADEEYEWPESMNGWIVEPGHLHTVEKCGQAVCDGTEDCPYDEGSFLWTPCDVCHRPLGGDRYPAGMFQIVE